MRKPNPNSAKEIKYEIKNKKNGSSHDVHAPCFSYDSDEALKLDNQLCFPLYAAARKIVGEYTPFLKPLGITYTQYITFMVLWEHDNIPVGDICAKLYLDNGTVTPLLKKMESEGYITRRRDGEDERKVKSAAVYRSAPGMRKLSIGFSMAFLIIPPRNKSHQKLPILRKR